ncbi:MAG: hypothetical protein H6643_02860 [Caldilineaceae bacterium]|nr:hypothetical protein [Caldilineaceae bacterium]
MRSIRSVDYAATAHAVAIHGADNLEVLPNAGHSPMIEVPGTLAALVDFLVQDYAGTMMCAARLSTTIGNGFGRSSPPTRVVTTHQVAGYANARADRRRDGGAQVRQEIARRACNTTPPGSSSATQAGEQHAHRAGSAERLPGDSTCRPTSLRRRLPP